MLWWLAAAAALLIGLMTVNLVLLVHQVDVQRSERREYAFWTLCHAGASAAERTNCFLQLVKDGNTRWSGAILDHVDLSHVDLSGVSFTRAVVSDGKAHGGEFQSGGSDRH